MTKTTFQLICPAGRRRDLLVFFAGVAALFATQRDSVSGQEASAEPTEIQAVFRISEDYLHEITDQEPVVADLPLNARVIGFCCTGNIHAEGKAEVKLIESGRDAVFTVNSHGTGHAPVRGRRGPSVAYGDVWGPFESTTYVSFDGRRFSHDRTEPRAKLSGKLRRVTGHRDRPIGRLIGRGAEPIAKKMVPRALCEAQPIAEQYLSEYIQGLADRITARLNETMPIEASINRLFPETRDWVFHMSTARNYLQAAYGPKDATVPSLPDVPSEIEEVKIEVWLRSTGEEAELFAQASRSPLARQLTQRYLESSLPELAAIAKERTIDAVGEWVLIRVGQGELPSLQRALSR